MENSNLDWTCLLINILKESSVLLQFWVNNCSLAEMLDDSGSRELEFSFNFHLCALQRILVTSEREPLDANAIREMCTTIKIQTIKIRSMTTIVPPGSFVRL